MVKTVSYVDEDGRHWQTKLPDNVDDAEAIDGMPAGPISLAPLNLPREIEIRLHNELFNRNLFTLRDLRRNRIELQAALLAAIQISAERVMTVYRNAESEAS